MNEMKIEAGDKVRAKCGGPVMVAEWVVDNVPTPFARCLWFDERKLLHTASVRTVALEPVQAAPP